MDARFRLCPLAALCLALFLAFAGCGAHGEGVRLAIVGGPESEKETLLLTAALSQKSGLEVLERAEIAKVLQEQRLERQGLTASDGARLGALLKADGLVLLEQTADAIRLRIVAVDSGAIVAFSSTPLPLGKAEAWSALRAAEIARLAPKLRLPRSEAIPISLMQINSALGGERGTVLEENTSSLLAARLSGEPKVIVLERARLQEAAMEKEFGAEKGSFWNSAWVIDGSVSELPSGFSIDLRLQPPGSGAVRRVKAEAPDLAGTIEAANREIVQALGHSSQPWDAAKEAARYGDEALWAAGNGFWSQAARAIEAAIALGESSPEALRWRWQCYNRLARNRPGAQPASGFAKAPGGDRPGAAQIRQMARCLELYHEALAGKKLPEEEERPVEWPGSRQMPPVLRFPPAKAAASPGSFGPGRGRRAVVQKRFGRPPVAENLFHNNQPFWTGPDEEGSLLLRAATTLIQAVEKPKTPPEAPEREALGELRSQIHGLFDALAKALPGVALVPCADDRVPAWNPHADPLSPSGHRPSLVPANLYTDRLFFGRAWETGPEPYFAFVRQCLTSDLPQNPHFFQSVLQWMARKAETDAFGATRKTYGHEWRLEGEALAAEKNLRLQVAGAFILCRTGAPVRGLGVFARHQERILDGSLSVDYAAQALTMHPALQFPQEGEPGESLDKATGALRDLMVHLLKHEAPLTPDVLYKLSSCWFTEQQAAELLAALRGYEGRHPDLPEGWAKTMHNVTPSLARRAKETVPEPTPPPSVTANASPSPAARAEPRSVPLQIGRAWVARNYNDPKSPGAICHALLVGDKIWMHVEFPGPRSEPARREFLTLDVPSLKSRVLYRDTAPETFQASSRRMGPSFATDGTGIYFWNGRGIRYVRAKESRTLEVPDLKRPFLWLIDGLLYAADEEGVLLRIDPATGHYEIVASHRRRPPQNALDAEPGLREISRIFRGSDGALAVALQNGKTWVYREAERNWVTGSKPDPDGSQLLAALENAWDVGGGSSIGQHANALIRQRNPADRRGGGRTDSALGYLPAQDTADGKLHFLQARTGVVSKGVFWSLLEGNQRNWLLKLDLSSNAFACRSVEFSLEYQFFIRFAEQSGSKFFGEPRLIPTPAGLVIFSPNEPVLWFVPEADLPLAAAKSGPSPATP